MIARKRQVLIPEAANAVLRINPNSITRLKNTVAESDPFIVLKVLLAIFGSTFLI